MFWNKKENIVTDELENYYNNACMARDIECYKLELLKHKTVELQTLLDLENKIRLFPDNKVLQKDFIYLKNIYEKSLEIETETIEQQNNKDIEYYKKQIKENEDQLSEN